MNGKNELEEKLKTSSFNVKEDKNKNNIYVTDSDYSRIVKFYPGNGIGVILAGANAPGNGSD
jgi:hypothetical protein